MSTSKTSTRLPVAGRHTRVAILGSGFSGLGMAMRLKQAGEHDFAVFEKEAGVGGTWRVNHYPDCACDVQSHLYSFSFEPNPDWSRMFARQPEIRAYLERCADKYALQPHLRLNTEISEARWDEGAGLWRLASADGRRFTAEVVIAGMGGLSTPAVPALPGIDKFKGKTFHSQQWDHDYELLGKRVAVIGTGASAIQFVPHLQRQAARVDLYQRTAPWVLPKPDRVMKPAEKALFRLLPQAQAALRGSIYSLLESRAVAFTANPRILKFAERWARAHIRRHVRDPELRAKLTPDYTLGCKRVLISNDYYPALARPNVDVLTSGIREVREHGIVDADGVYREVDAIIYGTGFKATDPLPRGAVFGRNGVDLIDSWPQGPEAYKGISTTGFPNLFFLMGPNTGLGHNSMVYMIESQIAYVLDALRFMQRRNIRAVDVLARQQAAFSDKVQRRTRGTVWTSGGCTSWYLHPETGRNVTLWPGYTWEYRWLTRRFDAQAYALTPAASTVAGEALQAVPA